MSRATAGILLNGARAVRDRFFTGYEIGDEQDRAKIREARPGYRRYE